MLLKFLLFSLVLLVVALFIPLKENQTLVKLQNDVRSKVQQVMNQDSSLKTIRSKHLQNRTLLLIIFR